MEKPLNFWTRRNLTAAITVGLVGILLLPAAASAQQLEPTADQYDDTRNAILALSDSGGNGSADPSAASDSVGSLPFTGLDVFGLLAVAIAIAGLGLLLQRAVTRDPNRLD